MTNQPVSAAKSVQLLRRYLPKGWKAIATPIYNRQQIGVALLDDRVIFCPMIRCSYTLLVFLHEVYHAVNHTPVWRITNKQWPRHIWEYDAEVWSMRELRKLGYRVTKDMRFQARENVYDCILTDASQGIRINKRILKWCQPERRLATLNKAAA